MLWFGIFMQITLAPVVHKQSKNRHHTNKGEEEGLDIIEVDSEVEGFLSAQGWDKGLSIDPHPLVIWAVEHLGWVRAIMIFQQLWLFSRLIVLATEYVNQ